MIVGHVTMDLAGRIVVPKEVRDRNGLHEGSRFGVEEDGSMRPGKRNRRRWTGRRGAIRAHKASGTQSLIDI